MLTIPNFERLKIFHIVYLNRSILKASSALNVTRSAVSQSLKILESELKVPLFIRDSKNFQPTSEADKLFQSIHPFVNELHATLQQFESNAKISTGHLRIGAPQDFGSGHLTQIIGKFRKKYPQVTFELILAVPTKQLDLLCDGKLDLAFIDNGDIHAKKYPVSVQTVMKEKFVMAASEKNIKKFNLHEKPTLKDLSEIPIVDFLHHAPVSCIWFRHHYGKIPLKLNVVFSAESIRSVLTAITEDIGFAVVPQHLLTEKYKTIKTISTSKKPFENQIMIARQIGKMKTLRETEFISFYKNQPSFSDFHP